MATQRVIRGVLYNYAGHSLAFLDTEQPYDDNGKVDLSIRGEGYEGSEVGYVLVGPCDDQRFPGMQAFFVWAGKRNLPRANFERVVYDLFDGCRMELRWVTDMDQEKGSSFWLALAKRVLSRF